MVWRRRQSHQGRRREERTGTSFRDRPKRVRVSFGGALASVNHTSVASVGLHFGMWKILGKMLRLGISPSFLTLVTVLGVWGLLQPFKLPRTHQIAPHPVRDAVCGDRSQQRLRVGSPGWGSPRQNRSAADLTSSAHPPHYCYFPSSQGDRHTTSSTPQIDKHKLHPPDRVAHGARPQAA